MVKGSVNRSVRESRDFQDDMRALIFDLCLTIFNFPFRFSGVFLPGESMGGNAGRDDQELRRPVLCFLAFLLGGSHGLEEF